MEEGRKLRQK
jgi:hypothetical protein